MAVPILLASWWALVIGGVNAALVIIRTALEDRTLHVELESYGGVFREVRYRLLPCVP